jgi:long-chain fatty acid transport protein
MRVAFKKKLIPAALAAASLGGAASAYAAGFALLEQNASGVGNAYAGSAAIAEDASTVFFNPAGMTLLPGPQVVVAGHGVNVDTKFSGTASTAPIPFAALGTNTGGNAGDLALIPNLYFAMPIGERLALGIGLSAPFGLKTEYDDDWLGRYQGIKSDLKTMNVNPSIAYKVSDTISLGAGLNYQKAEADLTNAVFLGAPGEGRARLEADDDGWGWNIGALFQVSPDMRIGAAYRSAIDYTLDGTISATTLTGVTVVDLPAEADVTFPDSFTLSVVQRFGEQWELLGDLSYTRWSEIDTITVVETTGGTTRDELEFDFRDAWRVALGLNYHRSSNWTFKGGLAWDQAPVTDSNRTVRLPDTDRVWLAIGAKYRFGKSSAIDVGYAHLFVSDADIDRTRTQFGTALSTTVNGSYDTSIDIFSVQLTYTF